METLTLETIIGPDGVLRIEAATHLAPGPAQVVVVVSPDRSDMRGVGKPRRQPRRRKHPAFGLWADRADAADPVAFTSALRRRMMQR